jgi:hypothetical protein
LIYCIMTSGVPLSDMARTALFKTAQRMWRQKRRTLRIVHDDVEGELHTKKEVASLGGISGYVYEGEVATPKGCSKARFIVRENDLSDEDIERGQWVPLVPVRVKAIRRKPMPFDDHPAPSDN